MFKVCKEQFLACQIFSEAKSPTLELLCENAEAVFYPKKHQIYIQDDQSTDFHLIVSGTVRAKGLSPEGKEVSYGDIGPGEIFGEFSALDGDSRSSGITAIGDVQALRLRSDVLRSVIEMDGVVAFKLLQSIVKKTRMQTDRVFEISVLAVRQRIHQELLRLAQSNLKSDQSLPCDENVVTVKIPTHQELANRIGTHREAVTRELSYLTSQNLIHVDKHKLEITDIGRLTKLAKQAH